MLDIPERSTIMGEQLNRLNDDERDEYAPKRGSESRVR